MNKTTLLSIVGGIIAIGILWFAYYAISPLFNTIKANDSLPVGPAIPVTTAPSAPSETAVG